MKIKTGIKAGYGKGKQNGDCLRDESCQDS